MLYSYNVSQNANNVDFKVACRKIESKLNGLKKDKNLIDVDGSLIQIYRSTGGIIKVFNDYEVDAVYVDSEINLDGIF